MKWFFAKSNVALGDVLWNRSISFLNSLMALPMPTASGRHATRNCTFLSTTCFRSVRSCASDPSSTSSSITVFSVVMSASVRLVPPTMEPSA